MLYFRIWLFSECPYCLAGGLRESCYRKNVVFFVLVCCAIKKYGSTMLRSFSCGHLRNVIQFFVLLLNQDLKNNPNKCLLIDISKD